MTTTELTDPQRLALEVLATNEGEYVDSWKRSSRREPTPRVNERAMDSLSKRGLATLGMRTDPGVWTSAWKYKLTPAGLEAVS